jgi:outer membrane lipoprotein SlyB
MALLAGLAGLAAVAAGQSIKMPDLRKPMTYQLQPGERCELCGRILSIREKHIQRRPAVPGALSSSQPGASPGGLGHANLVGAVVYLPLGNTDERPFVGGVGTPEMRERFRETTYEIAVRLDDGTTRFMERTDGTRFQIGDRVRIAAPDELELVVD